MKTNSQEETIIKYHSILKDLYMILQHTSRISMMDFSTKYNASKNLSNVLQKGGIIKMVKQGRYPEWKWNTIPPNKDMAIETLKRLSIINNIPKRGGKREGSGRKPKSIENRYLDSFTVPLFFGLTKINIKLNYKS